MRAGGRQVIPRPSVWRVGEPPAWTGRSPGRIELGPLVERVARRGAGRPPDLLFPGSRRSAVLVALFDDGAGAEVVLTRRAWHLTNHKGEVSFPGGRMDPGETPEQTAVREAYEEVALDPDTVTVVGELDHLATIVSKSLIVPVVATLPGRPMLTAAAEEVDRILTVPLAELLRADTYREERWGDPPLDRPISFFFLDDETVWGATGRILTQLLAIAMGTP
jgi:mutator protein MutT